MRFVHALLFSSAIMLSSCASIVGTANGPYKDRNLMFAGTKLNASIIASESCKESSRENYGCAYDHVLAPLSVLDFIPSLILDAIFLPFTALHAATHTIGDK
jgi:uncharacterized protein YceK